MLCAGINLNEVYLDSGNHGWFRIMRNNAAKIAIAWAVIRLGIMLAIISEIMQHLSKSTGTGFFPGLFAIDFAASLFDGSVLRQPIFRRSSMPQYLNTGRWRYFPRLPVPILIRSMAKGITRSLPAAPCCPRCRSSQPRRCALRVLPAFTRPWPYHIGGLLLESF